MAFSLIWHKSKRVLCRVCNISAYAAVSRSAHEGGTTTGFSKGQVIYCFFWWLWESLADSLQLCTTASIHKWALKSHAGAHWGFLSGCAPKKISWLIIYNIWAASKNMLILMSTWEKAPNKTEYMLVPFLSLHFWALHCNVYEHKLCSISLQQHIPPQFVIYYPQK